MPRSPCHVGGKEKETKYHDIASWHVDDFYDQLGICRQRCLRPHSVRMVRLVFDFSSYAARQFVLNLMIDTALPDLLFTA